MEDFVPDKCGRCGGQTTAMKDGGLVYLRCLCEWERGYHERLRGTVHLDFLSPVVKSMADWDPPLFRPAAGSPGWREMLEVQKIVAVSRLYNFAFKGKGPQQAIRSSIASRHNLFVRGPANSGRGLLAAVVKTLCAMRDISVTPLPCEFDIFKTDMVESEAFGPSGDEAKIRSHQKYEAPQVMVVENMRAEPEVRGPGGQTQRKRFRGSNSVDALLARRLVKPGSILATSWDFLGEISDALGDNAFDTLSSDKTAFVILFHPAETESLRTALGARRDELIRRIEILSEGDKGKRPATERTGEVLDLVADLLYFEEVFGSAFGEGRVGDSFKSHFENMDDNAIVKVPKVLEVWREFLEARKTQSAEYQKRVKVAQVEAVKQCKGLGQSLSEREMREVGDMLRLARRVSASGGDPTLDDWKAKAAKCVAIMSGKEAPGGTS
jgi:hypothetical protein